MNKSSEIQVNQEVMQILQDKYYKNPLSKLLLPFNLMKIGGYKLIRIKMKISFEACRKAMSV